MTSYKKQSGFGLIEVVVALFIFSSLVMVIVLNLLNVQHTTSLSASIDAFITNLRSQQMKAMVGDTEGNPAKENIGVYLQVTKYIDFYGTYNPSAPSNLEIKFADNIQIASTTFPSSQIIFTAGSGEIAGVTGNNTITIQNTQSGEQKTVTVNKYGVVILLN